MVNPCRVLEKQQSYIGFVQGRFKPIIKNRTRGVVFLIDTQPEEKLKGVVNEKMEEEDKKS